MLQPFCPACGFRGQASDSFCRACGALLDESRAGDPIPEAEALAAGGHLDDAIAAVQRAIGLRETPDLHVALSTLYLRRGGSVEARRALDRALAIDPRCAVAHAYLAGMDLHEGRVHDAQERLDHARDLAPDDLLVRIKRAEYWLRLGIFDNAKDELRHALQNGGGSVQNRALAETMFATVEKRSSGSFTRKTVTLPSLSPLKRLVHRRNSAPSAVNTEMEA